MGTTDEPNFEIESTVVFSKSDNSTLGQSIAEGK